MLRFIVSQDWVSQLYSIVWVMMWMKGRQFQSYSIQMANSLVNNGFDLVV